MDVVVKKSKGLIGEIEIPSDKSISHRAILFSLLMKEGTYYIKNFSNGEDCLSSLNAVKLFGVDAQFIGKNDLKVIVPAQLKSPAQPVYCGNSGTTMRLLAGILCAKGFEVVLEGDLSLSNRPMKRVIEPLNQMGANVSSLNNNDKAPIVIKPSSHLKGIVYNSKLASAQVKSCVLLCGMQIENSASITKFIEPFSSRDHTERLIEFLNGDINVNNNEITIKGGQKLTPKDIAIPGDVSSAAFFIAAALIVPNSHVKIKNINLNSTRRGIIDVFLRMGAKIEIINQHVVSNEEVCDVIVKSSKLKGTIVEKEEIPKLIDEIPILCVTALFADGKTIIKDAQDLKNKETDRIMATYKNLSQMGGKITPTDDGFIIEGGQKELQGNVSLECYHDHRIAMSSYVCGLMCQKSITIKEFEWVNISFPAFLSLFNTIKQKEHKNVNK